MPDRAQLQGTQIDRLRRFLLLLLFLAEGAFGCVGFAVGLILQVQLGLGLGSGSGLGLA